MYNILLARLFFAPLTSLIFPFSLPLWSTSPSTVRHTDDHNSGATESFRIGTLPFHLPLHCRTHLLLQCHKLAVMASVTEKVKETLVGGPTTTADDDPVQFSAQTRSEFMQYAIKDEETG